MHFTTKFAALLTFAVAASAASLAELSVVLFDDVNLSGKAYAAPVVSGQCFTLPPEWLDRAESVIVSGGWTCGFHEYTACAGPTTQLSGTVNQLPTSLYNNIESFVCTKA